MTKKSDITDFYFNLSKNVAYGASEKSKKQVREEKEQAAGKEDFKKPEKPIKESEPNTRVVEPSSSCSAAVAPLRLEDKPQGETSAISPKSSANPAPLPHDSAERKPPSSDEPKQDHHKKSEDAIAAAKERFLARKKAKMN